MARSALLPTSVQHSSASLSLRQCADGTVTRRPHQFGANVAAGEDLASPTFTAPDVKTMQPTLVCVRGRKALRGWGPVRLRFRRWAARAW